MVAMHWKDFLRKHWGALSLFLVAGILLFAGAIYVFRWFSDMAQSSGLVPSSLGLWTMNHLIKFIIFLIGWELLLIGIPLAVGGVIIWQWWKRLPSEDQIDYNFGRRSRKTKGGGGGSFLFFIAFCIKVYVDGNWNVPIATWTVNYVVDSMIFITILGAIIFGIPGAFFGVWWIRREMKRGAA